MQELLKKCHQCMEIIVNAKEKQADQANKNAAILLDEIDAERTREESKKERQARKRERKKQKKKERLWKDKEPLTGEFRETYLVIKMLQAATYTNLRKTFKSCPMGVVIKLNASMFASAGSEACVLDKQLLDPGDDVTTPTTPEASASVADRLSPEADRKLAKKQLEETPVVDLPGQSLSQL